MQAYLDNSATTRVDENVINLMTKIMRDDFGNPSSKHMKGVESEKYLKDARETIAGILKVKEKEIVFTSGGTESNNMALVGTAMASKRSGKHIITTAFEHDSVLQPARFLNDEGFEITYLPVDSKGHIDLQELKDSIRPDTILVSIMFVNNEMGAIQDISQIGKIIKQVNPKTVFHVDAVQAFGKLRIYPKKMGIDLLSVSAHKIHGPKGAGFLYINEGVKIKPIILGGGQQKGMRSGTDNVPGAAGMALAAETCYKNLEANAEHMTMLKDRMCDGLEKLSEELKPALKITINNERGALSAPHIVSATFQPVKSEVLLHSLEDLGIFVSAGSACSSNRKEKSHTLASIGLDSNAQDCTLRFSFCDETTDAEIDYTLETLESILPKLSKFVSK